MKRHNFFWGSSYDRGLSNLLFIWSDVVEEYPDAQLHVCYGWEGFLARFANNPERMKWKHQMDRMLQLPGVIHHGRVGKGELKKIRQQCGVWAYPTKFTEINCITALAAQKDGLVPITTNVAALKETVGSGIKIDGDIHDKDVLEEFKEAVFRVLKDPDLWKKESKKAKSFAKDYYWDQIADKWTLEFERPVKKPLVTIFTPTIREGWWDTMLANLNDQSYKNIEWVIVDDHPSDRSELAKQYDKSCDFPIKYFHVKNYDRLYSLVRSNNIAIDEAGGELFVFLQDFVYIKEDALERLVDIYSHNPDAFIAPIDRYYTPKIKPNLKNNKDWFDGESWKKLEGKFIRENVRQKHIGLRESDVVTDFEHNFGAVPTKILRDLNGYYEFFDDGMGYDDTEIIYRAFRAGYRLLVDDSVVATCIDHQSVLGNKERGINRARKSNLPRYEWMVRQMEDGKLPIKRDSKQDESINLDYEVPEDVTDNQAKAWARANVEQIIGEWSSEKN